MNENETVMVDEKEVYEISYIFDNRLDEGKALEKADSLKKDIASLDGSFISEETPYIRELSYEMTRVVNNVNVRFSEGYFGWVKFELTPNSIEEINKKLKLDEEVIRFLIVKAIKGNDIFTKELPVMKSDPAINVVYKEDVVDDIDVNIDTTKGGETDLEVVPEVVSETEKVNLDEEVKDLEN